MEQCRVELESAEPCSGHEQLAEVVLALVRAEVWKEEAVAVKTKGYISFRCCFTNIG